MERPGQGSISVCTQQRPGAATRSPHLGVQLGCEHQRWVRMGCTSAGGIGPNESVGRASKEGCDGHGKPHHRSDRRSHRLGDVLVPVAAAWNAARGPAQGPFLIDRGAPGHGYVARSGHVRAGSSRVGRRERASFIGRRKAATNRWGYSSISPGTPVRSLGRASCETNRPKSRSQMVRTVPKLFCVVAGR